MLFTLLKIPARFAFWIYCRKVKINNKAFLYSDGPLLIASNHPNSFLDAVIIATLFKRPVYSLARGDAFSNKFYSRLLKWIKILPVYRISEGAENLEHNYTTFESCKNIFRKNGIVLIFSEGNCINEWHLRPLKKGTARLAISSWQDGIPLKVLPLGINYNSFQRFGKNIQLNFGCPITETEVSNTEDAHGKNLSRFNVKLQEQLQQLVMECNNHNPGLIKEKLSVPVSRLKKIILFIPALTGYCVHFPLYVPLKRIAWKSTIHKDHFDSVMVGALFLSYLIYLPLVSLLIAYFAGACWGWVALAILPFSAWSYIQLKKQF